MITFILTAFLLCVMLISLFLFFISGFLLSSKYYKIAENIFSISGFTLMIVILILFIISKP